MQLAYKINKLFSGQAMKSAGEAFHRALHPIAVEEVMKGIDTDGLDRIKTKYGVLGELTHWPKYVDARRWLRLNIRRAQDLRLNIRRFPLRILDLGSGGGYFLIVARYLGHSGLGLDIDDPPMYEDMFEVFGLKRVVWRIEAFEPLPELNERFDLVTAFSICFNGHKTKALWTSKEWEFLLNDLKRRFVKPHGEIFLGMNPEPGNVYYTPELKAFFLERGAQVDRAKVWFKRIDWI
jgi:SAM-dependent methyltransferase